MCGRGRAAFGPAVGGPWKGEGMAIRLGSTVINCADLERMTRFWAGALDLKPSSTDPDDDFRVLKGAAGVISLQVAETRVSARDQMHLDLYTDDQVSEVALKTQMPVRIFW